MRKSYFNLCVFEMGILPDQKPGRNFITLPGQVIEMGEKV